MFLAVMVLFEKKGLKRFLILSPQHPQIFACPPLLRATQLSLRNVCFFRSEFLFFNSRHTPSDHLRQRWQNTLPLKPQEKKMVRFNF